jgi:hypothetical protein
MPMKVAADLAKLGWLFPAAVVALSILVLAALVQASVWVANKVIDGGRGRPIPGPGVRRAMAISLAAMGAEFVLNYLIEGAAGARANGTELKFPDDLPTLVAYGALSLVAGFIAWCCALAFGLPTSFPRAALAALALHLIVILIGAAIGVAAILVLLP